MAAASVKDVAALARVSVGTVSNVLNRSTTVSPDTAKRVLDAIDQLGFIRNDAARQLRVGRSSTIGMMVLDVSNPFFTDVGRGVEHALVGTRRTLMMANTGNDPALEQSYLDAFEEQRVSGLLITPVGPVVGRLDRLRARGIAVVLVDRHADAEGFSSVSVDDVQGGRLAARHLLETGRERLAFLGGPVDLPQVRHRLQGAREEAARRGTAPIEVVELRAMDVDSGRAGAERLLGRRAAERPDAIFAANDLIALGVLQALVRARLRVPDDVALIGYDDVFFAANAAIPLTSIRQPAHEMGETAARLLLTEIAGEGSAPEHIVFQPTLVVRESTVS
ncbi:LacI family DNA-binding transcriptional regulator [Herbiconiux sp. P15]|uniref:LacI family DNA-binding transcriptional regulator n=1 Tax=Herbiconiux liukaitaii TaxID=3342799 RepID=UPI0035B88556